MSKVNFFLQFPETNKINNWSLSNEAFQTETGLESFVARKIDEIEILNIELYNGFYDSDNLNNFLSHFSILEDLYPSQPSQLLLDTIKDWYDWRDDILQKEDCAYRLFGQDCGNTTLAEIAERKKNKSEQNYALLNNSAININEKIIKIEISKQIIEIDNLKNTNNLKTWISENRIPQRKFHVIEKHSIEDAPPRMWHGRLASHLHCSEEKAGELLKIAIGETINELFAYDIDKDEFIVYKYENVDNLYHGYHVPKDSKEISDYIKSKLK